MDFCDCKMIDFIHCFLYSGAFDYVRYNSVVGCISAFYNEIRKCAVMSGQNASKFGRKAEIPPSSLLRLLEM